MGDEKSESSLSDKERELIKILRESKIINFEQVGEVIARVGPDLFNERLARGDYIISVFTSFIRIIRLGFAEIIDTIADLRQARRDLRE